MHTTRPVTKKKISINNNPINTTAPVMRKVKTIKTNLMRTTRPVTKKIKNEEEIKTKHGKQGNVSSQLYFNSET